MNACCRTCGQALKGLSRIVIEKRSGTVSTRNGYALLRPTELALVDALYSDAPAIHSVDDLRAEIDLQTGTTVRRLVHDVRLKIAPLGVEIVTVHGVGYHLAGDIR